MSDALSVRRLHETVGDIRAPVTALGYVGVEQAANVRKSVAERIRFLRKVRNRRELDGNIRIPGERERLLESIVAFPGVHGLASYAHVICNQRQVRVAFRDAREGRRL